MPPSSVEKRRRKAQSVIECCMKNVENIRPLMQEYTDHCSTWALTDKELTELFSDISRMARNEPVEYKAVDRFLSSDTSHEEIIINLLTLTSVSIELRGIINIMVDFRSKL